VSTDQALTPFGGLVPLAAFLRRTGIVEQLAESCPVRRTSPNALPVYDVVMSFLLTAVCDGRRFAHVQRLREDPALKELFGLRRGVVGEDAIRRLFAGIETEVGARWVEAAQSPVWTALPTPLIIDWDSTVQTKYGRQEGAEIGYNPHKRGRRSFHPLLAVAAGTRLCLHYRFRPGNSVTATQWSEAMEQCQAALARRTPAWMNRGDIGLGQESILAWHEAGQGQPRPRYLFKLKLTSGVRGAIAALPEQTWQGAGGAGVLQVAELPALRLHGWSAARRVVVGRRWVGVVAAGPKTGQLWEHARHEYEAYVTNLRPEEVNAWQVVDLYRGRGDAENVFDELKNQWGFNGFCSQSRRVTALAARLLLLIYNLWNLFLRLMHPSEHIEAARGRRWFLLIAARLVQSGRQKTMHVAATGAWWKQLRDGYQRVAEWLAATAPQLPGPPGHPSLSFTFLLPMHTANCGI
jgi:hypothetical protein